MHLIARSRSSSYNVLSCDLHIAHPAQRKGFHSKYHCFSRYERQPRRRINHETNFAGITSRLIFVFDRQDNFKVLENDNMCSEFLAINTLLCARTPIIYSLSTLSRQRSCMMQELKAVSLIVCLDPRVSARRVRSQIIQSHPVHRITLFMKSSTLLHTWQS